MPRRYRVEFRREVLDLVEAGMPMAEIAERLGLADQTMYNWRDQDRIDRGLCCGVTTVESAELTAARKPIRELETDAGGDAPGERVVEGMSGPKPR